jgi:hypothetical protein
MSFRLPGDDVTAGGFLAAGITVFGVTGIIVGVRVYNSYGYTKQLFLDDYLAVFAWVLQVVNFGMYIELFIYLERIATTPIREFTQFLIAEAFIGGFAIYFAKVPVLVLFSRLFGIRTWLRVTVWTTLGVGFATFLASLLYVAVECSAARVHDAVTQGVCIESAGTNGLVHGSASLILDIVAFAIPLPVVWNLKLSTSKKVGLCVVFAAGIFAIVASTVALYYKVETALGNPVSNLGTGSIILSFLEASTAIIVGCVPALRSFWINQLPNSTVYSKLRSLFSSQTLNGSQSTQSALSKPSRDDTDHIAQGSYIELNEANSTHKHYDSSRLPSKR